MLLVDTVRLSNEACKYREIGDRIRRRMRDCIERLLKIPESQFRGKFKRIFKSAATLTSREGKQVRHKVTLGVFSNRTLYYN